MTILWEGWYFMSRKYERFSYRYGWRTAPESYEFFFNGKLLDLDSDISSDLGYLCICGKAKEAEDKLKQMLRKEEKQNLIKQYCIAFFAKDSNQFFFVRQLAFDLDNIQEKLDSYKRMKRYIIEQGCVLKNPIKVKAGEVTLFGQADNGEDITKIYDIDLSRFCIIPVTKRKKIFKY